MPLGIGMMKTVTLIIIVSITRQIICIKIHITSRLSVIVAIRAKTSQDRSDRLNALRYTKNRRYHHSPGPCRKLKLSPVQWKKVSQVRLNSQQARGQRTMGCYTGAGIQHLASPPILIFNIHSSHPYFKQ